MGNQDIAIVGISIFCPTGGGVEEFWQGISQGGDFITDVPEDVIEAYHFNGAPNTIDRFYCKRGGFCKPIEVDPLRYGIMPITASGTDPEQLLSLLGVEQALQDAGIFEKNIPLQKSSIIIGKGNFGSIVQMRSIEILRMARQFATLLKGILPDLTDEDLEKIKKAYQAKQGRYQADMATGTMPNLVASLVANRFDMQGPSYLLDAACSSGIVAINHSISLLRSGQCDIAVAGAMHAGHSAMFWGAFDMLGALSRRQVIAPFSEDADGLLIGQGGGFVVLKTLDKAIEDGDRIYALIKETAVCSDGASTHVMITSVEGQLRLLEQAWTKAGMDPENIGYIEAHGTGTIVGDRTEISTLKTFFGDNTHRRAYVGSVKSNIGHTMPAAGMIGVIKTALSLYWRKIPPTLHCERPQPAMFESRFLPPQELIDWDGEQLPLIAGVNAFGFGGINAHAIMTAYEPETGQKPYLDKTHIEKDAALQGQKPPNEFGILTLPRGIQPLLVELPELNEIITKRYGTLATDAPDVFEAPRSFANPIAAAADANIRDAIIAQREMSRFFEQQVPALPTQVKQEYQKGKTQKSRKGEKFEEALNLRFEDHPYLIDHAVVRQPKNWPILADLNPVVPFTMTIELLAEIAMKHAPGEKLIKIANISALKWIGLDTPFDTTVKGEWIGENVLKLDMGEHANAECTFGDEWPKPPQEFMGKIDIGKEIMPWKPITELYERFSFHGPQYQSSINLERTCERGMYGLVKKLAGKGSLLDIFGQQLGLFLHLTQTENTISFPVRLKELLFYGDIFDQDGTFEDTLIVTRLTDNVIAGDIALKRDGNIWCVARDFICQRFANTIPVWKVILDPGFNKLAEEIAPNVLLYSTDFHDNLLFLLAKRYLAGPDREHHESLESAGRKREHIISRVALKDAVRLYLAKSNGEMLYPVELFCSHDENGKPFIHGYGHAAEKVESLFVSLAHKGNAAVAIVAESPVGIDLESIETKAESFLKTAFTEKEIEMIKGLDETEAAIRFWVAKEAYAKKIGIGLMGDPKRYEVSALEGDTLIIEGSRVKTAKVGTDFIIGWTL